MVAFALLFSGMAFSTMYPEYANLRSEYLAGQFSVVEGRVTHFHPMPYEGHEEECFSIGDQTFCYSDYVVTPGFNNCTSHGGPIREGLPVRVSYIGSTIVRLEVRADALPSVAGRTETEAVAKADWQRREEVDPVLDRMMLGFAVAVVFMTGWWNLQPQRFMRFWLRPPYKPLTVVLFRLFFGANLIGAIYYLIAQITRHRRDISQYRSAAEIAAA